MIEIKRLILSLREKINGERFRFAMKLIEEEVLTIRNSHVQL